MQTFGDAASASSSASIPASVKVLPFLRPGKLTVPVRPTPWPAEGVEAAGRLGAEPEAEAPTLCPTLVPTLLPATQPAPPRSSLSPSAALEHDARSALTSLQLLTGLLAEPGVLPADQRPVRRRPGGYDPVPRPAHHRLRPTLRGEPQPPSLTRASSRARREASSGARSEARSDVKNRSKAKTDSSLLPRPPPGF